MECFKITGTKLYIPVVNLSIDGNIKFLKHLKQGFRTAGSWNKYRSEITIQAINNNMKNTARNTLAYVLFYDRLFPLTGSKR